tara:strand:+ start:2147 stop:2788 length:642 start_codon:yes stop_codon:yes gene_type:complete
MASPIVRGQNFGSTETVTATKLQNIVDNAAFKDFDGSTEAFDVSGSTDIGTCVLAGGLAVKTSTGQLEIKDAGVTAAKLAANVVANLVYPVGSIFTTVTNYANSAAVVSAIGGTTWTAFGAGRVVVGLDSGDTDFDTVEETGGAKTHTLGVTEIPAHTHTINNIVTRTNNDADGGGSYYQPSTGTLTTESTGGGSAHNNIQPYIVVYMWKRTA